MQATYTWLSESTSLWHQQTTPQTTSAHTTIPLQNTLASHHPQHGLKHLISGFTTTNHHTNNICSHDDTPKKHFRLASPAARVQTSHKQIHHRSTSAIWKQPNQCRLRGGSLLPKSGLTLSPTIQLLLALSTLAPLPLITLLVLAKVTTNVT